jgi:L-threonylcarbamoyladenylate synthase
LIDRLLGALAYPLTATSANVAGDPEPESVREIHDLFGDQVALYLDGGSLSGPSSTVVDCTDTPVAVLRPGAIDEMKIRKVLA